MNIFYIKIIWKKFSFSLKCVISCVGLRFHIVWHIILDVLRGSKKGMILTGVFVLMCY